jgi:hypothetical protein
VINYASSRHPTPHAFADGKLRFTPIRYAAVEVFAVTLSPDTKPYHSYNPELLSYLQEQPLSSAFFYNSSMSASHLDVD